MTPCIDNLVHDLGAQSTHTVIVFGPGDQMKRCAQLPPAGLGHNIGHCDQRCASGAADPDDVQPESHPTASLHRCFHRVQPCLFSCDTAAWCASCFRRAPAVRCAWRVHVWHSIGADSRLYALHCTPPTSWCATGRRHHRPWHSHPSGPQAAKHRPAMVGPALYAACSMPCCRALQLLPSSC